jgi:hypothetical protein
MGGSDGFTPISRNRFESVLSDISAALTAQ